MNLFRCAALLVITLALQGCGTYSTASVTEAPNAPQITGEMHKTSAQIMLTTHDIVDRKYKTLGDISVTVRKDSLFADDPTEAKVNDALKEKAADMGADAVILVRYGTVGIGFTSWGVLDGNGRAIVFQ